MRYQVLFSLKFSFSMKKYPRLSSAAVVIGSIRVKLDKTHLLSSKK